MKARLRPDKWAIARQRRLVVTRLLTPPRLFVGSFLVLVLVGTLGLKYLPGLYVGAPLGWWDALFTATSAVCVTGLIVVDTANYFTTAGQAWILALIQLGGLGMIAFSSVIIIALGRRLSLRQEALATDLHAAVPLVDTRRLTVAVMRFTLLLEATGAVALYLLWISRLGWRGALWPAVFHSVSAFCNAGFSTFSNSLMAFQRSPLTLAVIMALIVAGGLGFLTLEELNLRRRAQRAKKAFRVSLHSRLVVYTTLLLIIAGWITFWLLERHRALGHLPVVHQGVNALFMSITARTAGFNTIDYATVGNGANFFTILLMMIGGSPGSTAGGVKTTTFALIGLLAWSRFVGYETTMCAGRSVREETTERAVGLFVIAFGLVTAAIFVMTATHRSDARFLSQMFEVTSALNTVGLSMGETHFLSPLGKLLIVGLMFFGRVGPLTLASAIAIKQYGQSNFRYAYEDVVVG